MAVSTFCGVLVWGKLPLFSFPTLGLLPAFLEEAPGFFKTQSSTDWGVRVFCKSQGPSPTSTPHPQSHPGSLLNIHERVGWHFCDLGKKNQRPLINLLSDTKHFNVESGVCYSHLTPEEMWEVLGAGCLAFSSQIPGEGECLSLADLTQVQVFSCLEILSVCFLLGSNLHLIHLKLKSTFKWKSWNWLGDTVLLKKKKFVLKRSG